MRHIKLPANTGVIAALSLMLAAPFAVQEQEEDGLPQRVTALETQVASGSCWGCKPALRRREFQAVRDIVSKPEMEVRQ